MTIYDIFARLVSFWLLHTILRFPELPAVRYKMMVAISRVEEDGILLTGGLCYLS